MGDKVNETSRAALVSVTAGMANSMTRGKRIARVCAKCQRGVPAYTGRYPSRCPMCKGTLSPPVEESLTEAVGIGTLQQARASAAGRPFRAPHHTASRRAVANEVGLAQGGVLYLSEFPEFPKLNVEVMAYELRDADVELIVSPRPTDGRDKYSAPRWDKLMAILRKTLGESTVTYAKGQNPGDNADVIATASYAPTIQRLIEAGVEKNGVVSLPYFLIGEHVPGGVEGLSWYTEEAEHKRFRCESPTGPVLVFEFDDAKQEATAYLTEDPVGALGYDPREDMVEDGGWFPDGRWAELDEGESNLQEILRRGIPEDDAAIALVQTRKRFGVDHPKTNEAARHLGDVIGRTPSPSPDALRVLNTHVGIEVRSDARRTGSFQLAASVQETTMTPLTPVNDDAYDSDRADEDQRASAFRPRKTGKGRTRVVGGTRFTAGSRKRRVRKDVAASLQNRLNAKRGQAKRIEAAKKWHKDSTDGKKLHRDLGHYNTGNRRGESQDEQDPEFAPTFSTTTGVQLGIGPHRDPMHETELDERDPYGQNTSSWIARGNKLPQSIKFVSARDLAALERILDSMFASMGIDIEFTRHFLDRVNDKRNKRQITTGELSAIFNAVHKKHAGKIKGRGSDWEAVIKDITSAINIPFVLNYNRRTKKLELIAKTVMRKKGFKNSNKSLTVQTVAASFDRVAAAREKVSALTEARARWPEHGKMYKHVRYPWWYVPLSDLKNGGTKGLWVDWEGFQGRKPRKSIKKTVSRADWDSGWALAAPGDDVYDAVAARFAEKGIIPESVKGKKQHGRTKKQTAKSTGKPSDGSRDYKAKARGSREQAGGGRKYRKGGSSSEYGHSNARRKEPVVAESPIDWVRVAKALLARSAEPGQFGLGYRAYLRAIATGVPATHLTKVGDAHMRRGAIAARNKLIDAAGVSESSVTENFADAYPSNLPPLPAGVAQENPSIDDLFDAVLRRLIVIESTDVLEDVNFDENGSIYLFFDPSLTKREVDEVFRWVQAEQKTLQLVASPDQSLPGELAEADWWVMFLPGTLAEGDGEAPPESDRYLTSDDGTRVEPAKQQIVVDAPPTAPEQLAMSINPDQLLKGIGESRAQRWLSAFAE